MRAQVDGQTAEFQENRNRVVPFDTKAGFTLQ